MEDLGWKTISFYNFSWEFPDQQALRPRRREVMVFFGRQNHQEQTGDKCSMIKGEPTNLYREKGS